MSEFCCRNATVLYDCMLSVWLDTPSFSACWGDIEVDYAFDLYQFQTIYLSSSSNHGKRNTLDVARIKIPCKNTSITEGSIVNDSLQSQSITYSKRISHPGQIRHIQKCKQHNNLIATAGLGPDVFLWNVTTQTGLPTLPSSETNMPDLILRGDISERATSFDFSPAETSLVSVHRNCLFVYNLDDTVTSLSECTGRNYSELRGLRQKATLDHKGAVSSSWHPFDENILSSVGNSVSNNCLLWDMRCNGSLPIYRSPHPTFLSCISWNKVDDNLILVGSANGVTSIVDLRMLSSVYTFDNHSGVVSHVEWAPFSNSVFSSAGIDGNVFITDVSSSSLNHTILKHSAHHDSSIQAMEWNQADQWGMLTLSNNSVLNGGGCTLQAWRPSELLYLSQREFHERVKEFL